LFTALLVGGIVALDGGRVVSALDGEQIRFEMRVPTVHRETVESSLTYQGTIHEEQDTKGLPLVFIFAGAVLIPYLANALISLRDKIERGGVVIDARDTTVKIQIDKALNRGVMVVVTNDGVEIREKDDLPTVKDLIEFIKAAL